MGNLVSQNKISNNKTNRYGSSRRIYLRPQFDKIKIIRNIDFFSEHLLKQTLVQNLSEPTAIGKFNQKPNTSFEDKQKNLPTPKIKSQHLKISAIELNKLKNDINTLRQLLRIETDQKIALIELVKKQQLNMLNNIKYYQVLNVDLQNKINKLKSIQSKSIQSKSIPDYKKQIKDLNEQLEIIQTKLQIKLNDIRNNTYNNILNLKQLELLRNKERILVLENKQLSYIIQKVTKKSVLDVNGPILCQDKKGKLFYVSDLKCSPNMIDVIKQTLQKNHTLQKNSVKSKVEKFINSFAKVKKLEKINKKLINNIKHSAHINKIILCQDCCNYHVNKKYKLCDKCIIFKHYKHKFNKFNKIIRILDNNLNTYSTYNESFISKKFMVESNKNRIIFYLILVGIIYLFFRYRFK